ncbi:major capsid protein [Mycobacterium phage Cosmo]|uniref:Major capsid protein n=1 Tax=Mycobacterium phage Cosmo TaxID=1567467 RepID=A0A0B4ZXN3_9CAUD|nr:major capsid protein [Mycobacterium phage Cosmo]
MANAFSKPTAVVDTAIQMLQNELILTNLVWLNGIGDFAHKFNDTITVRVPAPSRGHTRKLRGAGAERNLTVSDFTEDSFPVTLTDVAYHLGVLTDEELTFDLESFATQILPRQVRGVADILEEGVRDMIVGAPYEAAGAVHEVAPNEFFKGVNGARRALNELYIPQGRVLVVGTAVTEQILNDDRFIKYESQGQSAVSALQEARLGRIYGYEIIESTLIPHGDAYLYHPTAFIMATRAPAPPMGAVRSTAISGDQRIAMRWLVDYDSTITSNRSLIDTYFGLKVVEDPNGVGFVRARKIHLIPGSIEVAPEAGANATITAAAGEDHTVQLRVTDANGDDVTALCDFESSATDKATVSAGGLVTGVEAGTSTVTATLVTPSGDREDTIVITVV